MHDERKVNSSSAIVCSIRNSGYSLCVRSPLNPVNRTDENGYAPLHYAAYRGNITDILSLVKEEA